MEVGKKKYITYLWCTIRKKENMEFTQYLGFLAVLTVMTIGFWLMMFLVSFVSYWVGGATIELIKEKRANNKAIAADKK